MKTTHQFIASTFTMACFSLSLASIKVLMNFGFVRHPENRDKLIPRLPFLIQDFALLSFLFFTFAFSLFPFAFNQAQTLENSWKAELGEKYDEIHRTYLHNIGNLILTEFNSEIGNKPFEVKKRKLETSSLNYRLDVIKQESWNENSIHGHQANMINWFLETFPLPDRLKDNTNWNTKSIESNLFSPLDNDAGELAEGNKPIEIHIDDSVFKVKSWQDVFINFIKYLRASSDFDFGFILDNQLELFKREETIVKWSTLKDLIDLNIDLSARYKTFDGKIWTKVKDIENDLLFIHINISASNCMTRIGNVMEKFNMPDESVKIALK